MSNYETHIGQVRGSTFAIGDNARAKGTSGRCDRDDMADALTKLLNIVSKYTGPEADKVRDLALAARPEITAEKPEKEVFRRLADATRKMLDKLGSRLIEAGALAEAVDKITTAIHHL